MKKSVTLILATILFISCQSTPEVAQAVNPALNTIAETPPVAYASVETPPVAYASVETPPVEYASVVVVQEEAILPKNVSIRNTERGKVLVANERVLFEFGKYTLPSNINNFTEEIIKYILDNNPNIKIIVESHTGNTGQAYPANYKLSLQRANTGKEYFDNLGIPSSRIMNRAFGESLPEFPEQKNLRRYEFVLIENDEDFRKYSRFFATINTQNNMTYDVYSKRENVYKDNGETIILIDEEGNLNTYDSGSEDYDGNSILNINESTNTSNGIEETTASDNDTASSEMNDNTVGIEDATIPTN